MKSKLTKLYIGRDPSSGIDIGIDGNKHLLVTAQNEAGKGSGIIIPNLLGYPSSILNTDPNLENANVTAGPCSDDGFEVFVFDPYKKAQGRAAAMRASWNLLADIDIHSISIKEDLWMIGEGCIAEPRTKGENAQHFVNGARELLVGAIAHILTTEKDPARRTLPWVRTRIEFGGRNFFEEMADNFEADGLPAAAARRLNDAGTNEAGGFLSTLYDQTRWLSSKVMQEHLSPESIPGSRSFRMEWLHSKKVRLYVGLPSGRSTYQSNYMRLIVNWAFLVLGERKDIPTATGYPVTLLLDEFGSIGHLDYIDRHLGDLRHYCRLAPFIQGLDQLKKDYPHSYEGFLQNCAKVFFGIEDLETAKYVSAALGDHIWNEYQDSVGVSTRGDDGSSSFNAGRQRYREPIWSPEMVMRMLAPETRRMLMLVRPHAFVLERVPYWERADAFDSNPRFAGQQAVDPSLFGKIQGWLRPWL